MTRQRRGPRCAIAVIAALILGAGSACAGAGGSTGGDDANTINVLMANNPQMEPLQKLTKQEFTAQTGIHVNYTVLPENDLRDTVNQEFASQAGQYDVASISAFEVPIFSANDWLVPLDDYVRKDHGFDQSDIVPAYTKGLTGDDGKLYAEPFYGESSFLMYRKDILAKHGVRMPARPTWHQVADIAAKVDGAKPGMAGICLRGQAGWGQNLAPLNTVVNTFGGRWYDKSWRARLTAPAFQRATKFYVDLVREHGEPGAAQAGVQECINIMLQGQAAMSYDATSIAALLEAEDSPVRGKMGYAPAPVEKTRSSGWFWTWAWGIQAASDKHDAAWKFISWASGKNFERQVGRQLGWTEVPAGKRKSLYDVPAYRQAAAAYYRQERQALQEADPDDPGVAPRPYDGIQFVGIPEFPHLGTQVAQQISAAIAGQVSVEEALQRSQELAASVGKRHQR